MVRTHNKIKAMDIPNDDTYNLSQGYLFDEQDSDVPMCQEPNCQNSAIECEIPGGYDHKTESEYAESYMYYCPDHARENGFCCVCGTFIAGWRDFSDMCENCEIEVRDDWDDEDEYDEYF